MPTPAPPATRTALVRRARRMGRILAETYPDAHCELDFESPLQLLVATILSAQCTDVRVNMVTPQVFAAYPTAADLAAADRAELESMIESTGFFRAKSASLQGMAARLVEAYDGEVPGRLKDLVTLPGVGRKTANVVLGNAFDVPGITVDTHFGRLSRRFGWTTAEDPVKVEAEVGSLFPRSEWTVLSHRLIWHGRRVCHARTPACGACPLAQLCPSFGVGPDGSGEGREAGQGRTMSSQDGSGPSPAVGRTRGRRLARCPSGSPPSWAPSTAWPGTSCRGSPRRRTPRPGPRRCSSCSGTARTAPTCCSSSGRPTCARTPGSRRSPAGASIPQDDGPVAAALREAQEETGLEPAGVTVARVLPDLWLPPSGYTVTPVIGYWSVPVPGLGGRSPGGRPRRADPAGDLVDPANRVTVVHPSGYRGPGFQVADMLVWGFTAGLLDRLLDLAGWSRAVADGA